MTAVDYDQIHADAIAESCNVPVDVAATAVDRYSRGDLARWVGLMYGTRGGKLFSTDDLMVRHGHDIGLVEVTSLWLLSTPRSQAHRGPQRTPRANVSRLTVFEVPS